MDRQLKSEKAVIGSMLLDPSCIDLVKKNMCEVVIILRIPF